MPLPSLMSLHARGSKLAFPGGRTHFSLVLACDTPLPNRPQNSWASFASSISNVRCPISTDVRPPCRTEERSLSGSKVWHGADDSVHVDPLIENDCLH